MALDIHANPTGLEHVANLNLRVNSPAKNRTDSGKQLCGFGALGDIVVGPDFKTAHLVERTLFCAVHDDANIRSFANHLADIVAVDFWQH